MRTAPVTNTAMKLNADCASEIDGDALAALLSSRICHDLSSPVNALMNGLDFMNGSDQSARDQALKLIADGAALAHARIQFFRTAFGASGGRGDIAHASELEELLNDYLRGGRVTLDWRPGEATLPRECVQLLLNIALVANEALPRGGVLSIAVMSGPRTQLVAIGEGPTIKFDDRIKLLLAEGRADLEEAPLLSKEAPALWAHRLAKGLRAELSFAVEQGRVLIAAAV